MKQRSVVFEMFVLAIGIAFTLLLLPVRCDAQAYHNPKVGSAERKAIMNAIRPRVEKDLSQPVVFDVTFLRSASGWALMEGIPTTPSGGQINWARTKWADAWKNGAWGGGVDALVHDVKGTWHVAAYVLGATDVEYVDWPQTYGCPKSICHLGGGN
jgi:hypothetical protein